MMTPMLAFALAKGSEMGFVSIASSLSQQLAMGSRTAGSFATQQALSTSSAISSPDGSMVSSLAVGKREDVFVANVGGSVVSMSRTGTADGSMLNHTDTIAGGSRGTENVDGITTAASVAGINAGRLNSLSKRQAESVDNAIQEYLKTEEGRQFAADYRSSYSSGSGRTKTFGVGDSNDLNSNVSLNTSNSSSNKSFEIGSLDTTSGVGLGTAGGSKGDNIKTPVNMGVSVNESIGRNVTRGSEHSSDTNDGGSKNAGINSYDGVSLSNDKAFMAAFNDHLNTSKSDGAARLKNMINSYEVAENFTQSFGNDTTAAMVNNYKVMNGATQAEALVALEKMAANGDLNGLARYAGMQNYENINGDNFEIM